jgi:hypothetical protein
METKGDAVNADVADDHGFEGTWNPILGNQYYPCYKRFNYLPNAQILGR